MSRRAFTLIELLAVMALILLLAVLAVVYLPKLTDSQKRTRAVDLVSQWLLIAKERARRDGLPTGLHLTDPGNGLVTQLEYVQQPDPLTGGTLLAKDRTDPKTGQVIPLPLGAQIIPWAPTIAVVGGMCRGGAAGQPVVTFFNADFTGGSADPSTWLVRPGDYLEVQGGGRVRRIVAVGPAALTLLDTPQEPALPYDLVPTCAYRIFREPRRLIGEDALSLPADVAIELALSRNLPGNSTVLFSPDGSVSGRGTSGGKVLLWIRDVTQPAGDPATTTILSVQTRTGLIAAQPVGPTSNPYLYTQDGRSSGM